MLGLELLCHAVLVLWIHLCCDVVVVASCFLVSFGAGGKT